MYLKRLEIQGFKSFARKTVLEFEPGITAVVGPNGSGKSNSADCLRWVLGEQSPKLMRGKKSDDVIFAGSDKKTRAGFAEVFATFDNHDHKIPIDTSEVSIGRRIDRSGESEYLINGNRVRLLDVVELVLKSNIGTSRYTVIGQGTIDQMILAGPPEIKNLIDEASGVKTYHMKREKTLRRLEQTAQNLMRAEDLINELEPRLKSLRRQAKRMEARAELEVELKSFQQEFLGSKFWALHTAVVEFDAQISTVVRQRSGIEQFLAKERAGQDGLASQNQTELLKLQALQTDLQQLQDQKNRLLENLSMIRGKMQGHKTAGGDPQSLQVELHSVQSKIAEAELTRTQSVAELEQLQKQHEEQAAAMRTLNVQLDQLYSQLSSPVHIDWRAVQGELAVLEKTFENFYLSFDSAQSVSDIQTQAKQLKNEFDKFKTTARTVLDNPQASPEPIQNQLQHLVKQKDQLQTAINTLGVSISRSKMAQEFATKQLADFEQERLQVELELKKAKVGSGEEFLKSLVEEEEKVQIGLKQLGAQLTVAEKQLQAYYEAEQAGKNSAAEQERESRNKQDELNRIKDQEAALQIEKARVDTQLQSLIDEIKLTLGANVLELVQSQKISVHTEGLEDKIDKLKHQLNLIGGVDELTIQEYQETETRYTSLSGQIEDLKKGMQDLRDIIEELDGHIRTRFNEAFHKINEKFESYFRLLFNGGRAYLSVVRAEDKSTAEDVEEMVEEAENENEVLRPEEKLVQKYEKGGLNVSGVDIKATPPGKKLTNIQALSGGERSLTSIALLCSLLACFPSPFVVLDEVDAALDEANTIRFGQILGTLSHQTQFITITHNRETMAQSNTLYGVTMGDDGISKLLSIKLEQAKVFAK